ncbi:helix-turn-helix domain-containing protein [Metabacillus litoralis]|uniref:helix-turn-helix domain-containing protein n=1 Tax=Metabacillus litoralis TaxID=152268 RepID=UPI001CFD46B9|nr:helix-turn-helix domain-containing protein [Metabacillus litoralis]
MEKFNYESIRSYQSFNTIEEMDQAVRGFLYQNKAALSEGTLSVLKFIWKHSLKVVGVSFAKHDTIAEAVQLSRRTVIRAVKKLEDLGIIKKIPTARMNGKQGVNILVLQPFEEIDHQLNKMSPQDVTVSVTPIKARNKQSSLCEKNNNKPNNVRNSENSTSSTTRKSASTQPLQLDISIEANTAWKMDTSFIPASVNKEFVQATQPYLNAIEIYKLWNRVLIAYNKVNLKCELHDVMELVINAFKQTIFRKKMNMITSTFEGYFYRVVYKMLTEEKQKERTMPSWLYDFIGDGD